jgi:hypothetical protein
MLLRLSRSWRLERSGSWLHDEVEYFLDVEMEVRAKRSRWCFDFEIW